MRADGKSWHEVADKLGMTSQGASWGYRRHTKSQNQKKKAVLEVRTEDLPKKPSITHAAVVLIPLEGLPGLLEGLWG